MSADPTMANHHPDSIELAFPLRAEHGATLRMLMASLGADAGFSVDEIDDLKLAVSEIFTLLISGAIPSGATKAHARVDATDHSVEICMHRGLSGEHLELDMLAATILSSVVDTYRVDADGISLSKHRSDASA